MEKDEEYYMKQLINEIGVELYKHDPLHKIKGINESFEKRLNRIGIYSFLQISKLQKNGIEIVETLTGYPGRIEREDWIIQALKLIPIDEHTDLKKSYEMLIEKNEKLEKKIIELEKDPWYIKIYEFLLKN